MQKLVKTDLQNNSAGQLDNPIGADQNKPDGLKGQNASA